MPTDDVLTWLYSLESLSPWLLALPVAGLLCTASAIVTLDLLDFRRLLGQKSVLLELTPPAQTNKSAESTHKLFSVLHGLEASRSMLDKLLRRKVVFSLEIVSTREQGIRYILRVPKNEISTFEHTIISYIPDAKLRRIDDFMPPLDFHRAHIIEAKQTGHFAYPLHTQVSLDQNDSIAYLTGTMTKLAPNELMVFQVVVSPTKVREADILAHKILRNEELVYQLGKRKLPILKGVFSVINTILFGIVDAIGDIFHGPSRHSYHSPHDQHKQQVAMKIKPARMLSAFEQKLAESVHDKLNQPLFRVSLRALIAVEDKQEEKQRTKGIRDWLASFTVPKYQAVKVQSNFPFRIRGRYRRYALRHRLPAIFTRNACMLSASELADLYHFPNAQTAKTENVVKSLSKTLSAPLSLKNGTPFDVVIGRNYHHGTTTDIGLTANERERHAFIVGGTGNGKTTLLKYAIIQDIRNGKGVAVVDPHGDLAQELLAYIPDDRIDDVIYFNPNDKAYPIGLNLLEVPEGLTGDQLLDAKDFIAETVVSIMRKTFSDDGTGGHRIEYVLRNTVLTALTVKDATIFTVYDLLTDKDFRKPIVDKLEQGWLKNFWNNEYGKAGEYQQVKMMGGVTSKIGRYHASVSAERILEQPKSTINFDEILDGKILICNLAKGLIGEDTSEIFGISILAKLQLASFTRIKQKRTERRPFYAYVDEFQNFATVSFVEMLSEARKYKLFLTMAEQTTSQQDDQKMVNTILANTGTIVCFKSNSPADEQQMLPLFAPYVNPGEISNLPAYNFYAKLSGGLEPQEPVSGMTIVLGDEGSEKIAEAVVAASRKNYAKEYLPPPPPNKKIIRKKVDKSKQTKGKEEGRPVDE